MVRVIAKPAETESTLDALLATTFVTRVDRATLSVIAPLLSKCLKSRQSNMHRKAGMVSGGRRRGGSGLTRSSRFALLCEDGWVSLGCQFLCPGEASVSVRTTAAEIKRISRTVFSDCFSMKVLLNCTPPFVSVFHCNLRS